MKNHLIPNGKQDVFSSISLNYDDKSVITQQQQIQQSHDEVDRTNHVKIVSSQNLIFFHIIELKKEGIIFMMLEVLLL